LPNPFLPRSPGGGTSTDRSASNPLNLIKPPFFREKFRDRSRAPFFESTRNFDHICCLFYQFKLFFSRISPLYMFKKPLPDWSWDLIANFCRFSEFFFLANTNHLNLAKIYQFWSKRISVFREKNILSFEMLPPFGDCFVQLKSFSAPDLFATLIIRSNKK